MEIKHTVEILTKDIQDIEKVVRNLNNYASPPQIEVDLAMSKLRRVYELLSIISYDLKSDLAKSEQAVAVEASQQELNSESGQTESTTKMKMAEATVETPADLPESPVSKPISDEQVDYETSATPPAPASPDQNNEPDSGIEQITIEPEVLQKKERAASILAEKFESDKSLNDKIASVNSGDIATKIKGGPIDSIKRNIGINDRFLIIRELMNGDSEGYNMLIQKLDDCANFNEAFKHIETRFTDHLTHDGVKILIDLSRRKFISRGNV